MGHPAREPPNVRPTGRRWVHLSRRANAAPPIRSRPLGKGLLETGAGMGQQGALYAGTRAIFHEALALYWLSGKLNPADVTTKALDKAVTVAHSGVISGITANLYGILDGHYKLQ